MPSTRVHKHAKIARQMFEVVALFCLFLGFSFIVSLCFEIRGEKLGDEDISEIFKRFISIIFYLKKFHCWI